MVKYRVLTYKGGVDMRKLLIPIVIVLVGLTLFGCAGAGDYDIELSGGYSLIRSSAHQVTINKRQSETSWESAVIPTKIVEIAWDDKYILAKQVGLKRRNPKDSKDTYEIPDESKVSYWILEVKDGNIYGPLTDKDFDEKKKELNISKEMSLKEVSHYKKD